MGPSKSRRIIGFFAVTVVVGLGLSACADPNSLLTPSETPTVEPTTTSTTIAPPPTTVESTYTPEEPTIITPTETPSDSVGFDQQSAWLDSLTVISQTGSGGSSSGPFTFRGSTNTDTHAIGAYFNYTNWTDLTTTYALGAAWQTIKATICVPDDSRPRSAGYVYFYDANDPAKGKLFTSDKILPGQSQDFSFSVANVIQLTMVMTWENQDKNGTWSTVLVFLTNATISH